MSTKLNDLENSIEITQLHGPISVSGTTTSTPVGNSIGDGPEFAIVQVGAPSSGASVAIVLEQSENLSDWSTIPGTDIGAMNAAGTVPMTFQRTMPNMRVKYTVSGTDPSILVAVVHGQQKKLL